MILPAIALALTAAVLHAFWNVRLKTTGEPLRSAAAAMSAGALIATPLVGLAWLLTERPGVSPTVWGLAALSSLSRLLYFMGISTAYRRGELSLAYPLARGTAPLLAVPAGLALGEHLALPAWIGVAFLLTGIWTVQRPAQGRAASLPAILAGVCIAAYTAVDAEGARNAPPWLYGWAIWVGTAALLVAAVWVRRRQDQREARRTSGVPAMPDSDGNRSDVRQAVVIGIPMMLAYLLILIALRVAPLMVVSPTRESAVVLVAGWGIWRLGERHGTRQRLAGTACVLVGVVLVAI